MGLSLVVFVAAAINLEPDWAAVGDGFVPTIDSGVIYWYFVVGLIAAALMPYEIYFYSSGGIEEGWTERDLGVNRLNAIAGFGLGGLLSVGVLIASRQVFLTDGISPESLGTVALAPQVPYGETGLIIALIGMFFAIGGATIDTGFSAAYNLAQHQGWKWGKKAGLLKARQFTASLVAFTLLALALAQTGVDPVALTEYAVIFSIPVLPLTYLPILLVARNRRVMGDHVNGPLANALGWAYFGLICILAVAAPILFIAPNGG
jgi:manganese transport protein